MRCSADQSCCELFRSDLVVVSDAVSACVAQGVRDCSCHGQVNAVRLVMLCSATAALLLLCQQWQTGMVVIASTQEGCKDGALH